MRDRELREKVVRLLLYVSSDYEKASEARCVLLGALTDEVFELITQNPFEEDILSWHKWNNIFTKYKVLWGNEKWEFDAAESLLGVEPKGRELTKQYRGYLKNKINLLYTEKKEEFESSLLW